MKLPLVVSFFCTMFASENDKTLEKVKEAKCDMLVSGSYITSSDDYEKRVLSLK